jgi:streptomycin 6-kinase
MVAVFTTVPKYRVENVWDRWDRLKAMFDAYLSSWNLIPDGEPIVTHSSQLLPVRQHGVPAMLKIATGEEERFGGQLMLWWNGEGAAQVLAHDENALLLERAEESQSLKAMARNGQDDEATRILCQVIARLHAPRSAPPPVATPLTRWFRDLFPAAEKHGGIFAQSAVTARELLGNPRDSEIVILHGDIHHDNVLDFGPRGWLAIDPKRLHGERGFDYANLFCNPDHDIATAPGRLARQVDIVVAESGIGRERLLRWILAWAGLSAAWCLEDNAPPTATLQVAEIAAAELKRL